MGSITGWEQGLTVFSTPLFSDLIGGKILSIKRLCMNHLQFRRLKPDIFTLGKVRVLVALHFKLSI